MRLQVVGWRVLGLCIWTCTTLLQLLAWQYTSTMILHWHVLRKRNDLWSWWGIALEGSWSNRYWPLTKNSDLSLTSIPQALVEAASNAAASPAHKNLYESFIGALFFGVPNQGLNDRFLHDIVKGQPNQRLISSLDPESTTLKMLHQGFTTHFDKKKYQFYSYYEKRLTELSKASLPSVSAGHYLQCWLVIN